MNRFIRLPAAINGQTDFQAYEDRQYSTLILLLRHLCISHRIARHFLGDTREEIFRHWFHEGSASQKAANRKKIHHFSGILHHRNVHEAKTCPGVLHRNRLYRGIVDEWWLPVQLDSRSRNYYSGPFHKPDWNSATPTVTANSLFKWSQTDSRIAGAVIRNSDIDAFLEAKSYFNLDQTDRYYRAVETSKGGLFPVGLNRVWHGGVHFGTRDSDPCVYAAASGTIVAARLSSNTETENAKGFGSQRFVLIRHAVHLATEPGPGGLGHKTNYSAQPSIIFSLYMHLAQPANLAASDEANPPWFNAWRGQHASDNIDVAGEKGTVFFPNVQVDVGDILGLSGVFGGRRMVHFEIFSNRNCELSIEPWTNANERIEDADDNVICDSGTLNRFVNDLSGDGIGIYDMVKTASLLRNCKTLHKSEWALTSADQLKRVLPDKKKREQAWQHIKRFCWLDEVVNGSQQLAQELGSDGFFWYYHPVTFMTTINKLVVAENREMPAEINHDTNIEIDDDGFIKRFVRWNNATNTFDAANASNDAITPQFVLTTQRYNFTLNDIACNQAHGAVPQTTKLATALLELLEKIRAHYGQAMSVKLAYLCADHMPRPGGNALCLSDSTDSHAAHNRGLAIDFAPSQKTNANCLALWRATNSVITRFTQSWLALAGSPTQAELPSGIDAAAFNTRPAVQTKLTASPPQALNATELANFSIHLELIKKSARGLRIAWKRLEIVNDLDFFGKGEWTLNLFINNSSWQLLKGSSVKSGETISLKLPEWKCRLEELDELQIHLEGIEKDLIIDDSVGVVDVRFDEGSSPSWGVGEQTIASSNNSFKIVFTIETVTL